MLLPELRPSCQWVSVNNIRRPLPLIARHIARRGNISILHAIAIVNAHGLDQAGAR